MWVGGSQDLGQSHRGVPGRPLPGHSILQTGQQRPGSFTFTSPCRDSGISLSRSPGGGCWGAAGGLGLYLGAGERGAAVCAGSPALHAAAPRALLLPLAAGLGGKRVNSARWGGPRAPPGSPRLPQAPPGTRGWPWPRSPHGFAPGAGTRRARRARSGRCCCGSGRARRRSRGPGPCCSRGGPHRGCPCSSDRSRGAPRGPAPRGPASAHPPGRLRVVQDTSPAPATHRPCPRACGKQGGSAGGGQTQRGAGALPALL